MAKKTVNKIQLAYSPDLVMKVITTPLFQETNFLAQDNPGAKVSEVSRTDDKLVLRAEVVEYAKGMTGIDRSKTEKTTTEYDWNLKQRSATWTYNSVHGKRVQVWGAIRIEGGGDSCTLVEEFNVNVKIPLMGGKVEKLIMKEVDKYFPKYEALVKEFCAKDA